MLQPDRHYSLGSYRYGFNGKENDNEVKGEGNQQDYGMRISDPRIGKFLTIDPLSSKYPELTPYQFASDNPIYGIDLDGLEIAFGSGYLVDKLSAGAAQLGLPRAAGFINTYGHSLLVDPIYSAHSVIKSAKAGDVGGTLKQFDPTGLSSLPDIYNTVVKADDGDAYAQGQILGMLPGFYGAHLTVRAGKVSSPDLPEGYQLKGNSSAKRALRRQYAESVFTEAGKPREQVKNLMETIEFNKPVREKILEVGDKVWRYERSGAENTSKEFFTDGLGADAGPEAMGFGDRSNYVLATYEVTKQTKVMESNIKNIGSKQYYSTTLQNSIKKISQ
jgi:RHS repeat-associated protein